MSRLTSNENVWIFKIIIVKYLLIQVYFFSQNSAVFCKIPSRKVKSEDAAADGVYLVYFFNLSDRNYADNIKILQEYT